MTNNDNKIVFYINGNDFKHSIRSSEVIKEIHKINPNIKFYIRSNAPRWIFARMLECYFEYEFVNVSVGTVANSYFNISSLDTIRDSFKLFQKKDKIIKKEIAYLDKIQPNIIVADMPSMAFEIASRIKVKSIGLANFSWSWAYEPYAKEYPKFKSVINSIKSCERKATVLLKLPFSEDMKNFKNKINIPLIATASKMSKSDILYSMRVDNKKKKLVYLAFGGLDAAGYMLNSIRKCKDFDFIVKTEQYIPAISNLIQLPTSVNLKRADIIKGADLVISKAEYGIVSECVANKTPMIYTSMDNYREYEIIKSEINKFLPAELMPRVYLATRDWKEFIDEFFKAGIKWKHRRIDGALIAAKKIVRYL